MGGSAGTANAAVVGSDPPPAFSLAQAEGALNAALATYRQAQSMGDAVDAKAYAVGRVAAEAEVGKLETEANLYYDSLLTELSAHLAPSARAAEAAAAARPDLETVAQAQAMVTACNNMASQAIMQAKALQTQALTLATKAQWEQSVGQAWPAQQDMMQAHQLIFQANNKKAGGMKFRQFAESVNTLIPSYDTSAHFKAAQVRDAPAASMVQLKAAMNKVKSALKTHHSE
jgi:predicted component of type VI protein secretion system